MISKDDFETAYVNDTRSIKYVIIYYFNVAKHIFRLFCTKFEWPMPDISVKDQGYYGP